MNMLGSMEVEYPLIVSFVEKGVGSFFDIYISGHSGKGRLCIKKEYQCRIWIYLCEWTLYHKGGEIISSDELSEDNEYKLNRLIGLKLEGIETNDSNSFVRITFSNETYIVMDNISYEDDDEYFIFETCGKSYFFTRKDGLDVEIDD